LFTRLAGALEAGFGETDPVRRLRSGLAEGAEGVGLARLLLEDLAHAPTGFIVILDDFHLVDDAEDVVNAIAALIRDLPESGQLVITGRDAPGLSMTRFVVEGMVFPLGTDDLRFSPDETRALREMIRAASGDTRPDPDREADEDRRDARAEGWIAGI